MNDNLRARLPLLYLMASTLLLTLVVRLFFIQVVGIESARDLAVGTYVRTVWEPAPRGLIVDRDGEIIAQSKPTLSLTVNVSRIPKDPDARDKYVSGLARRLDTETAVIEKVIANPQFGFYEDRPVPVEVEREELIRIQERTDLFPGVGAREVPVREYPNETLASHVVGHVGRISPDELDTKKTTQNSSGESRLARRETYRTDDMIGKIGVEAERESQLRGTAGVRRLIVDAKGRTVREIYSETDKPERGSDVVLTIDADIQRAMETALRRGTELARGFTDSDSGELFKAPAGAAVAIDPRNGEILALASFPTFDPNQWVDGLSQAEFDRINSPEAQQPQFNRAIAEAAAPGSTFKPLTLAAALGKNLVQTDAIFNCPGFYRIGNRPFKDWKKEGHGRVGLSRSLSESCDIVYYQLGELLDHSVDDEGNRTEDLQRTARDFGFGSPTGIDLPGENRGLVPDEAWKEDRSITLDDPINRTWFTGDSANLAIGQGALQVTPLQLARAYAAIANGGTLYYPHVVRCVAELVIDDIGDDPCDQNPNAVWNRPEGSPAVAINPTLLEFITSGMTGTTIGEGTAAKAFNAFPTDRIPVAGKTGTAQAPPRQDFSWFAAYAPANNPTIAVAVLVEEAGNGSAIAAPIARRILEARFGLPAAPLVPGDRGD